MTRITTDTTVDVLLWAVIRHHGLPTAIVSDRGTQFTSFLWKRLCEILKVTRRLSTAFHPETDGSTERANQEVQAYVRAFTTLMQDDWDELLPAAMLAINNRNSASINISPFFLTHGYHIDPIQLEESQLRDLGTLTHTTTPIQKAEELVRRMKEAAEWAQIAMGYVQE